MVMLHCGKSSCSQDGSRNEGRKSGNFRHIVIPAAVGISRLALTPQSHGESGLRRNDAYLG
jgi:hypothetical protein